MILGILLLVAIATVVAVGARRLMLHSTSPGRPADAHAVRRLFQYGVLYGLLVVSAVGVRGLLTRAFERGALVSDPTALARSVAFTVVGVPLLVGLATWTRRSFATDPDAEARSLGWAAYVTGACLTGLAYGMASLFAVLAWATGLQAYDPAAVAGVVVWATVWGGHWYLDGRVTPGLHAQPHHLLGSLAGLGTSVAALALLVAGTVASVTGIGATSALVGRDNRLLRGAVLLVVGVPVWLLYWWRTAAHGPRRPLWLAYVLLVGVAGGLVTALAGASVAGYDVLVWLLGRPSSTQAAVHFSTLPAAVGTACAGTLAWWYHHTVVRAPARARTEVLRSYEYLMAGTALVAAAVGFTTSVVALVEALTSSVVLVGGSAVNTLLAAVTIMLVGGPVWALFWRRINRAARRAPAEEHVSPSRRIYLALLFGVAGVAAVVALLVGVYAFADDALADRLGATTLARTRFPIGILLSAGIVSVYHAAVYRGDRAATGTGTDGPHPHGPRFVLLVGPRDPGIAAAVARSTGGHVQAWRTDGVSDLRGAGTGGATPTWTSDGVLTAIAALGPAPVEEVVVVCESDGVHAIPVHRR